MLLRKPDILERRYYEIIDRVESLDIPVVEAMQHKDYAIGVEAGLLAVFMKRGTPFTMEKVTTTDASGSSEIVAYKYNRDFIDLTHPNAENAIEHCYWEVLQAWKRLENADQREGFRDILDSLGVEIHVMSYDGTIGVKIARKTGNDINAPGNADSYRERCLIEARAAVCSDRELEYGDPEDTFDNIAKFWSDYLGWRVTKKDVAMMMILLKVARTMGHDKLDNLVDIAGYAACEYERLSNAKDDEENGYDDSYEYEDYE